MTIEPFGGLDRKIFEKVGKGLDFLPGIHYNN